MQLSNSLSVTLKSLNEIKALNCAQGSIRIIDVKISEHYDLIILR